MNYLWSNKKKKNPQQISHSGITSFFFKSHDLKGKIGKWISNMKVTELELSLAEMLK